MTDSTPGAKRWFFPDGYLPEPDDSPVGPSHETISIMNTSEEKATVQVTVYFEEQEPIEGIELEVGARRDLHVRLDQFEKYGGIEIPRGTPYGLQISSNIEVICQLSRMDTRSGSLSLFTTAGYHEE